MEVHVPSYEYKSRTSTISVLKNAALDLQQAFFAARCLHLLVTVMLNVSLCKRICVVKVPFFFARLIWILFAF